jgi:hypothetical protein
MGYDYNFIESILNSKSPEADAAIISFSKLLALDSLDSSTVKIFAKIMNRNLPDAADILFSKREPESFFSTVPLTDSLISFALSTLSDYQYSELYSPIVLSCLGILMIGYNNPVKGMSIYKLSVSEIYHISKYLQKKEQKIKILILDFLEKMALLGNSFEVSSTSGKILSHWFDNSKNLNQIIPYTILK